MVIVKIQKEWQSNQHMNEQKITHRDIIIQQKGGKPKSIVETRGLYDPWHYVLIHPLASFGYANYIPRQFGKKSMYFFFCFCPFFDV